MSGSGNKREVFNTRERLVSTDPNRLQSFFSSDIAEVLARLLLSRSVVGGTGGAADYGAAIELLSTTTDDPLDAAILDGLRPVPIDGSVNLLITSGVVAMTNPDPVPDADDTSHKWIIDPGVDVAGALTLTPGAVATRVDVIECARTEEIVETDNRDVFNPATGLFSPTSVTKVTRGRLEYRIRTGIAGGGFPGTAAGWLPLAICSVPSTAVTWDDVIIWDVRPLVADRINAPFRTSRAFPSFPDVGKTQVWTDVQTPGQTRIYGQAFSSFGEYIAGGRLGIPPSNGANPVSIVDLRSITYQMAGFIGFNAGGPWYIYAVFPFGLPRWVRYTPAGTGGRVPLGMRGIPTVAVIGCNSAGRPVLGVRTPAATGLNDGLTNDAVALVAGRADAGAVPIGVNSDGHTLTLVNKDIAAIAPTSISGLMYAEWTFTDDTTHPGNARALIVRFYAEFTLPANWTEQIQPDVTVSSTGDASTAQTARAIITGPVLSVTTGAAPAARAAQFEARIPLALDFTNVWGFRTFKVRWTYAPVPGLGTTVANQTAEIVGWELGP